MILALSRPDPRKNIPTLVKAFGEHEKLREAANLVIVAGNRDDISELDKGAREVLTEVLMLVDKYNLYGSAAYPKHHRSEDVPDIYRLATKTKGVFVNPALTEPFGLTLLEAAATGLPLVATNDGGPRDIIAACKNGCLVDPLDHEAMGDALYNAVTDTTQWRKWSRNGMKGANRSFSWSTHADRYMRAARTAINQSGRWRVHYSPKSRLITADRILVVDVDDTLTGDREALRELLRRLKEVGERVAFGIATGRNMEMTRKVLKQWKVPTPQLLITEVGSAIHYGRHLVQDKGWERHINYRWRPDAVKEAMEEIPGLKPQPAEYGQGQYKISYDVDPDVMPDTVEITRHLRRSKAYAHVVYSHRAYLDILPLRASKGMALRYFASKWSIPLDRCLVAGDSGNDLDMLTGNTLSVVVGNHEPELDPLRDEPRIYFAEGEHARGVLEGIDFYDFFGRIRIPELEEAVYE